MSVHALINYINEFKLGLSILAIFHSMFGVSCCPSINPTSTICLDPVIVFDHYIYRSSTLRFRLIVRRVTLPPCRRTWLLFKFWYTYTWCTMITTYNLPARLSCNSSNALHFHSLLSSHDITRGVETPWLIGLLHNGHDTRLMYRRYFCYLLTYWSYTYLTPQLLPHTVLWQ